MVKKSDQDTIRLSGWNKSLSISSLNKCGVIKNVLQTIKIDSTKTMHEKIVLLKVALGIEKDFITPHENLFVNWDMLREMKKNGMSIGSQSCSHHIMSHLSKSEQHNEAYDSKQRLYHEIKENISSFAYPVGGKDAFTLETENILSDTGYEFAFSFIPGINRKLGSNKYHLNRFSIDNNCSIEQIKRQINKATIKFK